MLDNMSSVVFGCNRVLSDGALADEPPCVTSVYMRVNRDDSHNETCVRVCARFCFCPMPCPMPCPVHARACFPHEP